jgi:hypothetical protein
MAVPRWSRVPHLPRHTPETPPAGGASASSRPADLNVRRPKAIPAGQLEVIFEPFVQVERRSNNPVGGAGLGLAISRRLARHMDGEVSVA